MTNDGMTSDECTHHPRMFERNNLKTLNVAQRFGERFDLRAAVEQLAQRVPFAFEQRFARAAFHLEFRAVSATGEGRAFKIDDDFGAGITLHDFSKTRDIAFAQHDARHAQRRAVAGKNFGEAFARHGADAKLLQRLRRVFARRTTAKIAPRKQNRRAFVLRLVQRVILRRAAF